ncbi:uncharacterized protein LOC123561399 [Mercenaria mercenaria]|uniref:uncharacterized protein LOC123561399 n=1 Tax=Mercenaria mercenaria TaxID=6596 RepID=UPI00234F910B|nr:uncharacterized protein LOC123561399 [Mercenaria mercenaria]
MKILGVLLLLTYVTHVTGKNCISAGGNNDECTKGETDCGDGKVCMHIIMGKSNNIKKRCGAPQDGGCWCDPSLTSLEACEEGYSCQEKNGKFECKEDDSTETRAQCLSSDNGWKLSYQNDENGNTISGTIKDFIDLVKQGAQVKVYSNALGLVAIQHLTVSYEEQTCCINGCVHGQALFWAKDTRSPRVFNTFIVFSTTGNTHVTEFPVNSPENTGRVNSNAGFDLKWYTRINTRPTSSESDLTRYIKDGASVQILADNTIIPLDVVDLTTTVKGWSLYKLRDIFGGTEFNTTEQLELSMWSYDGELQKASWLLNDHSQTETEMLQGQTFNWLVDPCWRIVYRHSKTGDALSGSKEGLKAAVENGKGLRLKVGPKYYKARTIRQPVGTDEIIAQVYDSINSDVNVGQWRWLEVSTTGLVKTIEFDIGGSQLISDNSEGMDVTWFKEERVWTAAAPTDISDKVDNGADVRYRVNTSRGIISYIADYAQRSFVLPSNPPRETDIYTLYNDREIVFSGTDYLIRKSFVNWDTGVYTYHDYLVGSTTRIERNVVQSDEANIQFFFS